MLFRSVVEKIQTQMQSGKNVYDAWINDSDFIGTHFRYGQAVDLTEWMAGEAKDVKIHCSFKPDRVFMDPDAYVLQLRRKLAVARF